MTTPAGPTLQIKGVAKRYPNGVRAVADIDITVEDGELCVFVGPSGCGKSTLLRMVAGLETVTDGDILLRGQRVNTVDPAKRDIAMVFQNYALYPHMTVYDNLAYGLRNRRIPRSEIAQRVTDAAELLQIAEFLKRKPQQLSGGQRQRVAMGRAIVRDPAIFLFDEPLSNLDAKLRNQMRLEIRKLQRRLGVAAVYVTHDQVEAMTLADKIVVLNQGRVEQIGAPADVYHRPATAFVAGFIGAPPMNLLDVDIADGAARLSNGTALPVNGARPGKARLGLRPERLRPAQAANGGFDNAAIRLPIEVDLVEELGAGRLVHGRLGADAVIAHLGDTDAAPPPGPFWVSVEPGDLHLFDPDTGARL